MVRMIVHVSAECNLTSFILLFKVWYHYNKLSSRPVVQTNSLPQTFSDYFIKHSQVHNYPTRNSQDYSIYKANKAQKVFADRAIRTTGPTLWNSLDSKLKYCKTAKNFRNEFKSSLVNNYD